MIINSQYLVSAAINPILGTIVDKRGYIFRYSLLGGFIMLTGHILNMNLPDCDDACGMGAVPYIFYGLSYSI